jgi:hydroxymethylpyrimidine/phosphomethylpyrimidine kinase
VHAVNPAVALTIAGSDSGGAAGVQADLKTFSALGVFGTSALTAVTAQNTAAVTGVVTLDSSFVAAQIEAVMEDLSPAAAKTGMLATAPIVTAVAELAASRLPAALVVDPVMVSSTGHRLLDLDAVDVYRRLLLPRALVLTPNLDEAALLAGLELEELEGVDAMAEVGSALRQLGVDTVVVKGGHLDRLGHRSAGTPSEQISPDVVVGPHGTTVLDADRVATRNDHGTGCSLSAAITAELAKGAPVLDAIRTAKAFVHRAIAGAADWRLGAGRGPIDHFDWSSRQS